MARYVIGEVSSARRSNAYNVSITMIMLVIYSIAVIDVPELSVTVAAYNVRYFGAFVVLRGHVFAFP